MISETGSNVIVMLTKEVENDKIKCTHYWPLEPGNAFTFDTLRVTLVSEEKTFENRLVERTLELHHPDTGDRREIKHYQYLDWPDHGLPESAAAFRKILHKVDRVRAEQSPIVVHCSTLEKLHLHLKEKPDEPPEFNVLQTVLRMREQRVGMVQTKLSVGVQEQYIFCYKALLEETQKLGLTSVTADHLV
ncbi:Proteintyrosine phosphatase [Acanthamoeba castellanii str. Neff]|uniref:Proteintyrosine phosphatase n=1 Tax=Acanthamoeba castellanii (strain ATCC 30010 / Neff) TaxID=1257118 RepID=L8GNA7_ACACF|nr:Proteintyrosine phosphatase [Acanthamoeba castellanii str. Neff]ELR14467.1 Proteintyrosine phosphatase [Acanthamoeba castellanii str. Neff]